MGPGGMVENIRELGEYMWRSYDCSPPSHPDSASCEEGKLRIVDRIQATHLVIHFPAIESNNEIVEDDIINGLNNALQGTVIVVNEKYFRKDYWSSKIYKTMVIEMSPISNLWAPLWSLRFRII